MERDFTSIIRHFHIPGERFDVTAVTAGHINDTYILTARDGRTARYVLQRINQTVFTDPPRMMDNIIRVTKHIRNKTQETDPAIASRQLTVIDTDDGAGYQKVRPYTRLLRP